MRAPPDIGTDLDPLIDAWGPILAGIILAGHHHAAVSATNATATRGTTEPDIAARIEALARPMDLVASAYEVMIDQGDDSGFAMHYDPTSYVVDHIIRRVRDGLSPTPGHIVHRCYDGTYSAPPGQTFTTRLDHWLKALRLGHRSHHAWPSECRKYWSDDTGQPSPKTAVAEALRLHPGVPHPDSRDTIGPRP